MSNGKKKKMKKMVKVQSLKEENLSIKIPGRF